MAQIPIPGGPLRKNPELQARALQAVERSLEKERLPDGPQGEHQHRTIDKTRLSAELLEEASRSGDPQGNVDQLLQAIQGLAENRLDQQNRGQKPEQVEAAGGVDGPNRTKRDKPKVERVVKWTPGTREGEILAGRDVIGHAEVKDRVTTPPDGQQPKSGQGGRRGQAAGRSRGTGAVPGAGGGLQAGPTRAAQPAGQSGKSGDRKSQEQETDQVQLSPESQQLAQQMAARGAVVPGLQPGDEQKASAPAGKPGTTVEKTVMAGEVRTRATGWNQTAEVTSAGELKPGQKVRTFQKLDDMPLLPSATIHRKDGRSLAAELQDREAQGQAAGDLARPLEATQLERLRNPRGDN